MDIRQVNDDYNEMVHELIKSLPELSYIKDSEVNIIVLSSEHKKTKSGGVLVFGQCEKIADKYKWGIPCDFTITVFEPNIEGFTNEQLKILLFHELLHVGIDGDKYFVKPHDLEDFKTIIERYGVDWNKVD